MPKKIMQGKMTYLATPLLPRVCGKKGPVQPWEKKPPEHQKTLGSRWKVMMENHGRRSSSTQKKIIKRYLSFSFAGDGQRNHIIVEIILIQYLY